MNYFNHLISLTTEHDTLILIYSGHGTEIDDVNGDEAKNIDTPGKDDCLCPSDYLSAGFIVDDDLRSCVEKLPYGAKFRSILDCCQF